MLNQTDFGELQKNLTAAREIAICLPIELNYDQVASALALFLALKKADKPVSILGSSPMTVEYSSLVGVDKIGDKLGGRNLTIVLDLEESIENVSYNTDDKHLYLTVEPKAGSPAPSADKVQFNYSGSNADLVILVGTGDFSSKENFDKAQKFNLSFELDPEAASLSEMTAYLISKLGLPMTADIAGNLFKGIQKATANFSSPKVGATTFEAAAYCLRAGAKKQMPIETQPVSIIQPIVDEQPQSDWLAPKIYKGNQLI